MKAKTKNKLQYKSKDEMLMQFKEEKHLFFSEFLSMFNPIGTTNVLRNLLAWALLSALFLVVSILIF